MVTQSGLYVKRERTCRCGVVFVARKPGATYCSNQCRVAYTRYGRSYGTTYPRTFGAVSSR